MRKIQISKSKVYADFFTGGAIAWFSGGIIAPFISQTFTQASLILGLYSLFVTYTFIVFAIMFRDNINNGD